MNSGKYRDEPDQTVWKINFRCTITRLKDTYLQEIQDMQMEDCRVHCINPRTGWKHKTSLADSS